MSARKRLVDALATELHLERDSVRNRLLRVVDELRCDYERLETFLSHLHETGRQEVRDALIRRLINGETFAAIARSRHVRPNHIRRQVGSALRELAQSLGLPVFGRRIVREGRPSCVAQDVDVSAIPELAAGYHLYRAEEWSITGAAPKDYLAYGDPRRAATLAFIAKRPKNFGARECVTEAIIAEIGKALPLRVARCRLVRLPRVRGGPVDVRFMSQNFVRRGTEVLVHGAELVAEWLGTTTNEMQNVFSLDDRTEERRFYTIESVVKVLEDRARDEVERTNLLGGFARMLAFDAVVGAPDRHGMNWGILENTVEPAQRRRFAPVFDTARGMFWDHPDQHLLGFEQAGRRAQEIAEYAEKSRPVFTYSGGPQEDKINHFNLIRYILARYPQGLGRPAASVIQRFSPDDTEVLLRRRFRRVISEVRLSFVAELLRYRARVLKALVAEVRQ